MRAARWAHPGTAGRGRSGAGADESENRVRVELAQVKSLADLARAFGLAMPGDQDSGNRWQWVVNARPEAGQREVAVIQRDGRPMAKDPAIDTGGPGAGLPSPSGL
ncbi:hypothetical protein ACFLYD_02785 [Chloroflexota bacterium]